MRYWILALGAMVSLAAAPASADTKEETLALLLDGVPEEHIEADGAAEHFPGKKLFDYMNGGAERYLAYGFSDIAVRRYKRGSDKATLEIYRMGGPIEAFGVYAFFARGEHPEVGAPAALAHGALALHKDRYFVRAVSSSAKTPPRELLLDLARAAVRKLPGKAEAPAAAALLPPGAIDGSLRYLHKPEVARTVWFEGEGEVLLGPGKGRGFSALYAVGDEEIQTSRIEFVTAAAASKAASALAAKLGVKAAGGKREDDTFTALAVSGSVLRWVANAPDAATAGSWLKKVR